MLGIIYTKNPYIVTFITYAKKPHTKAGKLSV